MTIIGNFKVQDETYTGTVRTLTLKAALKFVPNIRNSENAPDYRVYAGTLEIGAAWRKTAKSSQRDYLSVTLDEPSFPAPIYARLIQVEGENAFELVWTRTRTH